MQDGLLGEFSDTTALRRAAERLREQGYRLLDAYSPYPVPGLEAALGMRRSPLTLMVFPIATTGGALAYLVMWFANAYAYPLNVGGRPAHAIPAFVPITFEMTVLSAGLSALFLVFLLSRLPRLSHSLFDVEGFERASIDRHFLAVDERDPKFDPASTELDLKEAGALRVVPFGGSP
jgi:hypothetical protein